MADPKIAAVTTALQADKPTVAVPPLLTQVQMEYNEGQDYLRDKKLRQVQQLVLLNNLARNEQTIAATTLFTFFNRVFSNLYSDVLQLRYYPSEDSDFRKIEVLSKLQQSDYQEMEMWQIEYDWLWDACFFGEGYVETLTFDKKEKLLKPIVTNPLLLVHDPYFDEPKLWRYYYKWRTMSKYDILAWQKKGFIKASFDIKRISPGLETEIWDYKNRRDAARKGNNVTDSSASSMNDVYQILEGFTHDENGNRIVVWCDKNFGEILAEAKLTDWIPEDEDWPIVRKQIFREPHSSLAISVPDLIEDKHRARSVLMNLMYMAAKDDANPIYVYNPDLVQDVSAFLSRQIFQHIAVDDINEAVKPMATKPAMSSAVNAFIQLLASESSDAIGTAVATSTPQKGKKSATDSAMQQQIADLTSSLQAKVIAMGEKEFWSQWYLRIINPKNMAATDQKVIKLTSVIGVTTLESIKIEDIKTKFPPKAIILSKKEAEYRETVMRRDLMQIYPVITKTMDPRSLNNYNKYVFFPKMGMETDTIDRIVPASIDQIKARQENELLEKDTFVPVSPMDDDEAHMYEHAMAKNTAAKWAHYFIHEKHRAVKQKQKEDQEAKMAAGGSDPNVDPNAPPTGAPPTPPSPQGKRLQSQAPNQQKVPVQAGKQSPQGAAVPAMQENKNNAQVTGGSLA